MGLPIFYSGSPGFVTVTREELLHIQHLHSTWEPPVMSGASWTICKKKPTRSATSDVFPDVPMTWMQQWKRSSFRNNNVPLFLRTPLECIVLDLRQSCAGATDELSTELCQLFPSRSAHYFVTAAGKASSKKMRHATFDSGSLVRKQVGAYSAHERLDIPVHT